MLPIQDDLLEFSIDWHGHCCDDVCADNYDPSCPSGSVSLSDGTSVSIVVDNETCLYNGCYGDEAKQKALAANPCLCASNPGCADPSACNLCGNCDCVDNSLCEYESCKTDTPPVTEPPESPDPGGGPGGGDKKTPLPTDTSVTNTFTSSLPKTATGSYTVLRTPTAQTLTETPPQTETPPRTETTAQTKPPTQTPAETDPPKSQTPPRTETPPRTKTSQQKINRKHTKRK